MHIKENIEEITDIFTQFQWLIYIPFSFFIGSSLFNIFQINKEIDIIETIIHKHVSEDKSNWMEIFDSYSFLAEKDSMDNLFYEKTRPILNFLNSGQLEASENWENKIYTLSSSIDSLCNSDEPSYLRIESESNEQISLTISERYPGLRHYSSIKLMDQIMYSLSAKLLQMNCVLYCSYFGPYIQKFGDSYFIYPDKVNRYGRKTKSEIRVNGELITDNRYSFHPKRRGMHILDIEYLFWERHGLHTINFRKGLLVK